MNHHHTNNHEAINRVQTRLDHLLTDIERLLHYVHVSLVGDPGSDVLHQLHSMQASVAECSFVLRDAAREVSRSHHPSNGRRSRVIMIGD